jgi:hypothetical protein
MMRRRRADRCHRINEASNAPAYFGADDAGFSSLAEIARRPIEARATHL